MQVDTRVGLNSSIQPTPFSEIIILSIFTLGIVPTLKYFQVSESYRRHLGVSSNFVGLFWGYIIASIMGGLLLAFGVGVVIWIGAIVLGALSLSTSLALRSEVIRRNNVHVQTQSTSTHVGVWVVGVLLSSVLVGLIPLILQAYWFFDENTRIASAIQANGGQSSQLALVGPDASRAPLRVQAPALSIPTQPLKLNPPAASSTASGKFCGSCGARMPMTARFCTKCGSAESLNTDTY
jgi:ribosomal protein L40E